MTYSDGGRYDQVRRGGNPTTVAQPATVCKRFGKTRYGDAFGICHSLHGCSRATRRGMPTRPQDVENIRHLTHELEENDSSGAHVRRSRVPVRVPHGELRVQLRARGEIDGGAG